MSLDLIVLRKLMTIGTEEVTLGDILVLHIRNLVVVPEEISLIIV